MTKQEFINTLEEYLENTGMSEGVREELKREAEYPLKGNLSIR